MYEAMQSALQGYESEIQVYRAPSTVCLLCASCRRRVTPCVVCAQLIPCCSCCGPLSWLECRKCSAMNPLGDQERRFLGFPPALALPSSMVRRVLIAHIGRPLSTLSTHLYHQHIQQALIAKQSEVDLKTQGLANDRDCCALEEMDLSRFSPVGLPFVQSDGIMTSSGLHLQTQIVDANDNKHMLVEANQDAGVSCVNCCRNCKCSTKFGDDISDEALRRCQEQLAALHCPEALSIDLDGSAYPICNTVRKSTLGIQATKTCNSRIDRDCSLGMGKGVSIDMLRVVSSFFIKEFEIWLAAKEVATSLESCKLEDILKCVEDFREKQEQLIDLQRSMQRAVAAQNQAASDIKVDPSLFSAVSMLEQFFSDRSKERMEKTARAAKPFVVLLKQISLFLEFLYTRTHAVACQLRSFPLCTKTESAVECNDTLVEKRQLQTAVSYWLLLYHDAAHALSVI